MEEDYVASSKNLPSYTDQFNAVFPYYLYAGMTYDQFWNDDCELVKYYREADKIRQQHEDQNAWLHGLYIYEALCNVSPIYNAFAKKGTKAKPYPKQPYLIAQAERESEDYPKQQLAKSKSKLEAWAAAINLQFAKKEAVESDD